MLGWYVLGWSMDGFGICWDGRACSWIDGSVGLNRLDPNGTEWWRTYWTGPHLAHSYQLGLGRLTPQGK